MGNGGDLKRMERESRQVKNRNLGIHKSEGSDKWLMEPEKPNEQNKQGSGRNQD